MIGLVAALTATPSPSLAGDPFINLPWLLHDVMLVQTMSDGEYAKLRQSDQMEVEMAMREATTPDDRSMVRTEVDVSPNEAGCDAFAVATFADFEKLLQQASRLYKQRQPGDPITPEMTLPQYRHWSGPVATRSDYRISLSFRFRKATIAAAVLNPGLSLDEILIDGTQILNPEAVSRVATNRRAGFPTLLGALGDTRFELNGTRSCDGFTIYYWRVE